MTDIKISIIVPAYNIQNDIERCVESIIAQTHSCLEIIIVDDGSTDDTPTLLSKLEQKDSRIKVIHKKNGGVTSARLRGVSEASGEYIGFVDGDDYIEPDMYERLIDNAIKYGAEISHCGYKMVFPNRVDLYYGTERVVIQNNTEGQKDLLAGAYIEPGLWNKIFRKSLFDKLLQNDLMDKSIKINEDLLMNYYLFREAHLSIHEDFCPYHYIVRADSAANKALNIHQLLDPIKVTNILLEATRTEVEVYYVVKCKYIRQLIGLATMHLKANPQLIRPNRQKARVELKKLALEVLCSRKYSGRIKVKVLWVAIWPTSYQWVHTLYTKITGLDKIYDLE